MEGARRGGVPVLVVVTLLWAISFPLVGEAVSGRPPGQLLVFLALRFSLATVAFLPVVRPIVRSAEGRGLLPWLHALGLGVLLFGGYLFQTAGLVYTTPSRSAFVTTATVPLIPFLAALVHRRAPSGIHVAGSLLAFLGVGLVLSPDGRLAPNVGDGLTFVSSFVFALELMWLERVARRSPVWVLACGQIGAVALFSILGLFVVGADWPASWPGLWRAVVVTGVLCTTVALLLMTWGQARVSVEVAAVIYALEPVFASLFELAYTGRAMSAWQWAGGGVVVAAVAFSARGRVPAGAAPADAGGGARSR